MERQDGRKKNARKEKKRHKIVSLKCTRYFQGPDPAEQENFICPVKKLAVFLGPWGKTADVKT